MFCPQIVVAMGAQQVPCVVLSICLLSHYSKIPNALQSEVEVLWVLQACW